MGSTEERVISERKSAYRVGKRLREDGLGEERF